MESTQSIRLRNRFGSLIENYKPDFLWWEIVVYSKNANISLRILICILALLIFTTIDELVKPFKQIEKQHLNLL
jgi:hypothetical protein